MGIIGRQSRFGVPTRSTGTALTTPSSCRSRRRTHLLEAVPPGRGRLRQHLPAPGPTSRRGSVPHADGGGSVSWVDTGRRRGLPRPSVVRTQGVGGRRDAGERDDPRLRGPLWRGARESPRAHGGRRHVVGLLRQFRSPGRFSVRHPSPRRRWATSVHRSCSDGLSPNEARHGDAGRNQRLGRSPTSCDNRTGFRPGSASAVHMVSCHGSIRYVPGHRACRKREPCSIPCDSRGTTTLAGVARRRPVRIQAEGNRG